MKVGLQVPDVKADLSGCTGRKDKAMKKSEMKAIAKDILLEALACAYYKLEEHDEVPEEEKDEIIEYINKYGQAMATRIGEAYYTL